MLTTEGVAAMLRSTVVVRVIVSRGAADRRCTTWRRIVTGVALLALCTFCAVLNGEVAAVRRSKESQEFKTKCHEGRGSKRAAPGAWPLGVDLSRLGKRSGFLLLARGVSVFKWFGTI